METKLKRRITESGFKQVWIANKIGITTAALSYYVNGLRVPPDVLARLADVLNCEPAELVGNVEEVTA